jgi:WD40 repeat protein
MKLGERSLLLSGEPGHGKTVYSVAISSDSETLATASRDHTIKLWNTCSGRLRHTLGGDYAEGHTNFVFKVCAAQRCI